MPITTIPLRCVCGSVTGRALEVNPRRGNRVVCYCDDCQSFAHWLGHPDILDENGGTDIFQLTPAQLRIDTGTEHLAAMRLSPKGALRWHTRCCKTPIANTMARPKMPFAGVLHAFMDHGESSRDSDLGPIRARVMSRFGHGDLPADAHPKVPFGFMARSLPLLVGARIRRAYRPSPFFDDNGVLRVEPLIISKEEHSSLKAACIRQASAS